MHYHPIVFFYGSYINLTVLKEAAIEPKEQAVAVLPGYELVIAPRANLIERPLATAYGILVRVSHAQLDRLYTDHALGVLGETYLPRSVVVSDDHGAAVPAMTYVSHDMVSRPAEPEYVERIFGPARTLGFPDWYLKHIASFRPAKA